MGRSAASAVPDSTGILLGLQAGDTTRAMVLFGARVAPKALRPAGESLSLVTVSATYDDVFNLAERLDVLIVPGKD